MVRLALTAVLALGLAGCNTSYNYFSEETAETKDENSTAFGAILTMTGMVPKQQEQIEYTPRAPLAIPGSTQLPDPDAASKAEAAVNFPVDQDEKERARRARLQEMSGEYAYEQDGVDETRNARTNPDQVRAMRREGGGLDRSYSGTGVQILDDARGVGDARVSREEMRVTIRRRGGDRQLLDEEGKPIPRQSLIQPPDTYRTPADTAALPEPGDIENSEWVKKRLYKVNDRRPARLLKED